MPNKDFYRELELGGLVGADGNIDRPLRPGWWPIFRKVEIRDKDIWWTAPRIEHQVDPETLVGEYRVDPETLLVEDQVDTGNMLDEFIKLPGKMPAAYLAFVRKYGPLRLHDCLRRWMDKRNFACMKRFGDHVIEQGILRDRTAPIGMADATPIENPSPLDVAIGVFGDHFPDGLGSSPFSFPRPFPTPDAEQRIEWTEPISVYRWLAIVFREILLGVKYINAGDVARRDAFFDAKIRELEERIERRTAMGLSIADQEDEVELLEGQKGVDAARNELQVFFARMVEIADIQPRPNWTGSEWKVELCFPTALGALVSKLMMFAVRADCLYTCSGCGEIYIRSLPGGKRPKRPKTGQRNYCLSCGTRASRLDAKRDYRRRLAEANRLRA